MPAAAKPVTAPKVPAPAITTRTRAVVTISPNNPTGAVYPGSTLRAINNLCRDRHLLKWLGEGYRVPGPPADEALPEGLDSER